MKWSTPKVSESFLIRPFIERQYVMAIFRRLIALGVIAIFCMNVSEIAVAQARLIAVDTPISSRETCPHASVLAVRDVFSNPLYVDLFRGMRSVAFGRPVLTGPPAASHTVVIFSDALMLVTGAP